MATQLAIPSSDDAAAAAKTKVDGHGLERHALWTELAAGVFESWLTHLATEHKLQTELVLGPQQLQGPAEQCHLAHDGLCVPLK